MVQRHYEITAQHWDTRELRAGAPTEIVGVLEVNLERDAGQPGFHTFLLYVFADSDCAQVLSMYHPGAVLYGRSQSGRVARGYRVWRTTDALALCGPENAILDI